MPPIILLLLLLLLLQASCAGQQPGRYSYLVWEGQAAHVSSADRVVDRNSLSGTATSAEQERRSRQLTLSTVMSGAVTRDSGWASCLRQGAAASASTIRNPWRSTLFV